MIYMGINAPLLAILAFAFELIDSSLGMGYGTSLTPILLLMGFEPTQIVPAILLSEFVTGFNSAVFHHSTQNVNLKPSTNEGKVAIILALISTIGTVTAVIVALSLPSRTVKVIIGVILVSMSIIIFLTRKRAPKFSWKKIGFLGLVASFNKGISGGGYGPLVMGGQVLSGIKAKSAVGITSLAESATCFIGIISYLILDGKVDWSLAPWLMAGAVMSVPFSVYIVKKIPEQKLKLYMALGILLLGSLTLYKTI